MNGRSNISYCSRFDLVDLHRKRGGAQMKTVTLLLGVSILLQLLGCSKDDVRFLNVAALDISESEFKTPDGVSELISTIPQRGGGRALDLSGDWSGVNVLFRGVGSAKAHIGLNSRNIDLNLVTFPKGRSFYQLNGGDRIELDIELEKGREKEFRKYLGAFFPVPEPLEIHKELRGGYHKYLLSSKEVEKVVSRKKAVHHYKIYFEIEGRPFTLETEFQLTIKRHGLIFFYNRRWSQFELKFPWS